MTRSAFGVYLADAAEVAAFGGRYGDEGLMRMGAVTEAMDANHPDSPHLYLFIVGIDPSRQGNGLGERLLAPTLAYGDATAAAVYLESTNPRSRPEPSG